MDMFLIQPILEVICEHAADTLTTDVIAKSIDAPVSKINALVRVLISNGDLKEFKDKDTSSQGVVGIMRITETKDAMENGKYVEQVYNLLVGTQMTHFNEMNLMEEDLNVVLDAYYKGKDNYTIAGSKSWIKDLQSLKIYTGNATVDLDKFYQMCDQKRMLGRTFTDKYYTEECLKLLGKDVTAKIIGNKEYGCDKQEGYFEVESKTGDSIDRKTNLNVFIVHGHDEALKNEVARFVSDLGLKPIILHEQPSQHKTIIEKIESHGDVGFGIVLYTPCDVGNAIGKQESLNSRARQNVVFEHGYLIGRIQRKNVCPIIKGDIELPGDISGVVYVSSSSEWKISLYKELVASGYDVDIKNAI